ncbi:MAG: type II toxin-antitoxin system VapC family toxin [Paracoccaceae bacterium]|nr:type II toxin-antitoxin system VapC family toxin [Paracoccaceae bacterium]
MGARITVSALLDTHAFLWWISDSARLSRRARTFIADEANDIVVSAASAWEITTKFRIGKLAGCEAVAVDVVGQISGQGFRELAIGVADAERAGRLPGSHRDPFDRMLAAQALARNFPIVSVDPVFDGFGVVRLW